MPQTHDGARALLVLSKDYGELGFASSLLRSQELARQALVLLPESRYSTNKNAFPASASAYATLDDIGGAIDAHNPDLVFLLSGYLFSSDRLLSPEALEALLRRLRDRGCRVVTSDPYLGLAPRLTLAEVDVRMHPGASALLFRLLLLFIQRVRDPKRKVARVPCLEDVIHLYPTSIPNCQDKTPRVSFFNPSIIRAPTDTHEVAARRERVEAHRRPRWLFLISAIDLHVQLVVLGLRRFTKYLIGLLRHAGETDRDVTLIAPDSMVSRLRPAMVLPDSIELLTSCPFTEFEQRLLEAEYVFYWNAFSFSQQARLANELPIFVFDRGHASRIVKPYYEIARSCHFGGSEPTYLDQRQPLDPLVLAQLAEAQKPAMRALRECWQASPTPDKLVNQLLGAGRRLGQTL